MKKKQEARNYCHRNPIFLAWLCEMIGSTTNQDHKSFLERGLYEKINILQLSFLYLFYTFFFMNNLIFKNMKRDNTHLHMKV